MVNSKFQTLYWLIIFSTQIITAQNISSTDSTNLNFKKLQGRWDSHSSCGDSSVLFVNNAKYFNYYSVYFNSETDIFWEIPANHHNGGSFDFHTAYLIKGDTLFVLDEYMPIPDPLRISYKMELFGDTALCLTRLRTLPSIYNYFKQEIFYGSFQQLSEDDKNSMEYSQPLELYWSIENNSKVLLYNTDTVLVITNPDSSNYSIIRIHHPLEIWDQSLSAIKTINGYQNFNQCRIIETPRAFLCDYDHSILLNCKLAGLTDKLAKAYFKFYIGELINEF